MTRIRLLAVLAVGLSAAGCSYNTTTTATVPVRVLTGSEQVCLDYGFRMGTAAYDRCVVRESEARARGRVVVDYSEAQLAADARAACYSYGLEPATVTFDRCVGNEMAARRYRSEAAVVVYPPVPAPAPTPYIETPNANTAGIPAFRDEYGYRYDAQGNRLDRNGNIISPQSKVR